MTTLSKWIRRIGWAVVAVLLLCIAINAFDVDLSEEAKLLAKVPNNPYPPEENLFVALQGLTAPPGESVIAVGQHRIAEHDRLAEIHFRDSEQGERESAALSRPALGFAGELAFCKETTLSCWAGIEKHAADVDRLRKANVELYKRYLALHDLPGFFETAMPSLIFTFPAVPMELRNLFLADTALRIKVSVAPGDREAAFAGLRNDIRLWRNMLRGEGGLLSKMIAIRYLHGDLLLLGEIVADRNIDLSAHTGEIETTIAMVQPSDWKIGGFVGNEFRTMTRTFDSFHYWDAAPEGERKKPAKVFSKTVLLHFLQFNATQNKHAEYYTRMQRVTDSDTDKYEQERRVFARWAEESMGLSVSALYNPFGRVLISISQASYDNYPLRAHDVEAFHRLVQLSYEIRKRGITNKDIPAFMTRNPQWATHPINGVSFIWIWQKHTLVMKPVGKIPEDRRFDIPSTAARDSF